MQGGRYGHEHLLLRYLLCAGMWQRLCRRSRSESPAGAEDCARPPSPELFSVTLLLPSSPHTLGATPPGPQPGRQTTFSDGPSTPIGDDLESNGGIRALLCEDNLLNAKVALAVLSKCGITAVVANDGVEGVQMWNDAWADGSTRFHLVFMDMMARLTRVGMGGRKLQKMFVSAPHCSRPTIIQAACPVPMPATLSECANLSLSGIAKMPRMDGIAATRRIREIEAELNRPPVHLIALTASACDDDREEFLLAGANDHVCKPIWPEVLRTAIQRFMDGRGSRRMKRTSIVVRRQSIASAASGGAAAGSAGAPHAGDLAGAWSSQGSLHPSALGDGDDAEAGTVQTAVYPRCACRMRGHGFPHCAVVLAPPACSERYSGEASVRPGARRRFSAIPVTLPQGLTHLLVLSPTPWRRVLPSLHSSPLGSGGRVSRGSAFRETVDVSRTVPQAPARSLSPTMLAAQAAAVHRRQRTVIRRTSAPAEHFMAGHQSPSMFRSSLMSGSLAASQQHHQQWQSPAFMNEERDSELAAVGQQQPEHDESR